MTTNAGEHEESRAKRVFEWILAAAAALVTVPIVLVLAVISTITFRAFPFFSQERIGRGGRRFRLVKIRSLPKSMRISAPKYELTKTSTTGFGRFVRRTHLDELPQLWLVLAGTMSLVGPRPEMPNLAEGFSEEFARRRSSVRPGCTGLWQISADAHRLINEAPEYDLTYVENAGLRLDLWIMWRTLVEFVRPRKRPTLADVPRWALRSPTSLRVAAPVVQPDRWNGHEQRAAEPAPIGRMPVEPRNVASFAVDQHLDGDQR